MGADMFDSLQSKVCVVTGAAGGIGLAIAKEFLAQGAKVAMIDIRGDELLKQADILSDPNVGPDDSFRGDVRSDVRSSERGGEHGDTRNSPRSHARVYARGYTLDITDRKSVFTCFEQIREDLGPVYALINNAGIVDQRPFTEITEEQMERMMRVNVNGTLFCCQAAVEDMKAAGTGRIVNFSSKSGKTGSALMAHYSAAKGAIIALTHALAFELANDNITVNCVCPGITPSTGVWDFVSDAYTKNLNMGMEEVIEKFSAKIPLGRLTAVEDIVNYVLFLVTGAGYCTGQAINITGGREVH